MTARLSRQRCRTAARAWHYGCVFGAHAIELCDAVGGVNDAVHLARHYFPKAQLQFVVPVHNALHVYGMTPADRGYNAGRLIQDGRRYTQQGHADMFGRIVFVTDEPNRPMVDEEAVLDAVLAIPPGFAGAQLSQACSVNRCLYSTVQHVAAYIALHHTVDGVRAPYGHEGPELITPARIISVSGTQDTGYYEAGAAVRDHGVPVPNAAEATAQLFTDYYYLYNEV